MGSDPTNTVSSSDGISQGLQKMPLLHGRTTGPTRRSTKGQWTEEEDEILRKAVQRFKGKNWKKIAECFKDRTDVQCLHRWQKVLNPDLVKGPWSKEEDEVIVRLVEQYGAKKWSAIAQHLPGRIGKQCRERWHNHLNPAINKEAWTQEEELMLIQAHQVYGNKWAELTKFLPGRTDNAIKNHWNSSVKKKLDSYMASGLLAQFQGLPCVNHTNQSTPTSSRTHQFSGDDSIHKDVAEVEETSECSQGSTFLRCSHSNNEMAKTMVVYTGDENQSADMAKSIVVYTGDENHQADMAKAVVLYTGDDTQPAENLNHGMDPSSSANSSLPSNLVDSSKLIEQNSSHGWPTSDRGQLSSNELQNRSSLDLTGESEFMHRIDVDQNQEAVRNPIQSSVGFSVSTTSVAKDVGCCDMLTQMLTSEDDCLKVMHPPDGSSASLFYQQSNCEISCADNSNSQSYYSEFVGTASYQPICMPLQLYSSTFDGESYQYNGLSVGNQEFPGLAHDGLTYTNDSSNSHFFNDQDNAGSQVQRDQAKDPSELVSADAIGPGEPNVTQIDPSVDENLFLETQQQGPGSLSYEPPRFPSMDIPFLSCDLIQSGGDLQHEYSPLGIRQLMMTSINCFSPCRLWDSPSHYDSPEDVLKSAAKTFTCTPSILKKRNRDLLSPLSEKRCGKKLERVSFFNSASQSQVMFDGNKNQQLPSSSQTAEDSEPFIEDKENLDPTEELAQKEGGKSTPIKVQQPPALVKQNLDDQFFLPDKAATISATPKGPHARTPGKISSIILETTVDPLTITSSSCENPCQSLVSPHTVSGKRNKAASRFAASIPLEFTVENDAFAENSGGMFGETPLKKSLESPSAWKSPWFSFLPGPRVDTDITIEDIGYFTSPGERSYDALGLMKQLSEHTASAYANAQEILGDETPDSILKKRFSEKGEKSQNVLSERRVLDFSECGSPRKGEQRHSTGISFSSPSSYLLKGCR